MLGVLATAVLALGAGATVAGSPAAADGVTDCASVSFPPEDGCGFYLTLPDGKHLVGTNHISTTTITSGGVVTQSATVAMPPTPVTEGNVSYTTGALSVTLGGLYGPPSSWSPQANGKLHATQEGNAVIWANADNSPLPAGFTATLTNTAQNVNNTCEKCQGADAIWTSQTGGGGVTGDSGSNFVDLRGGLPTAAFAATQSRPAAAPGEYQFVSHSTDPAGGGLRYEWAYGDGATTSNGGASELHTYAKPGTYQATLTVIDEHGQTATVEHDVVVAAPTLSASIDFVDAKGKDLTSAPTPKVGDTVYARLTVDASNGVGNLSGVSVHGVDIAPSSVGDVGRPTPALPDSFTLLPATDRVATFPVTVTGAGVAKLTATITAKDAAGTPVTPASPQRSFAVSTLTVTVTTDKDSFTEPETGAGPQPVPVHVTVTIANPTHDTLTDLNLRSLEATRDKAGELLDVKQTAGPVPDTVSGYPLDGSLAPGASKTVQATFDVDDDGRIDFSALVTAADGDATVRGYGETKVVAKPKYYLKFTSTVVKDNVPAGTAFVMKGTVTNLSDTATETVAPTVPVIETGNAGLYSFAWDKQGIDPKKLSTVKTVDLDPGDTASWTLTVLTSYSDPAGDGGVEPSGGTSAQLNFAPWAIVHDDDGTTFNTDPDKDVLATADDLSRSVSVNDDVPSPYYYNDRALAGAMMYGGLQGLWNAASGMVTGLIALPGLAVSTVQAVAALQDQAWDALTPDERDAFAVDTAHTIVPILMANEAKAVGDGAAKLYDQAHSFVLNYFATLHQQWTHGDYGSVVQTYSSMATNAIGSVAVPIVIGKLAKSSAAARALTLVEAEATQKLASAAEGLSATTTTVQKAAASLFTIPNGAIPTAKELAALFGIGPDELEALQKLATENKFVLTVRSRAASSLDWINTYSAMLKPEALKIKSVSALDVLLGYPSTYEGALVFKEPVPLVQYRRNGGDLAQLIREFVSERGFTPGTSDYDTAVTRVNDRVAEWNEWSAKYKYWSKRKWIDVSFNWDGNAMSDPTVSGSGKFAGFNLKPLGEASDETYVVQMYNQRVGRYVPVTGDIDPIAFTHPDGSPLTPQEHAKLLNDMRRDPNLLSQHGESTTYVNGGIKFIAKQFKKGEALVQISADGTPRIVRFNQEQSVWRSATDYHLVWDGGAVDTGSAPVVHATLDANLDAGEAAPAAVGKQVVLPLPGNGASEGANVGRCSVSYSTAGTAPAMVMGSDGKLTDVVDKQTSTAPQENTCFTDGPVVTLTIKPTTVITKNVAAGTTEIPIDTDQWAAQRSAGSGLAVGETVTLGAGSGDAEDGTIVGFGSIILQHGITRAHHAGEVIVVRAAAPRSPSASAPVGVSALADTGSGNLVGAALLGVLLATLGSLLVVCGGRRKV